VTGTTTTTGLVMFCLVVLLRVGDPRLHVRGGHRACVQDSEPVVTASPFRHRTRLLEFRPSVPLTAPPTDPALPDLGSLSHLRSPRSSASSKGPLGDLLSPYETYSLAQSNSNRCVLGVGTPPTPVGAAFFELAPLSFAFGPHGRLGSGVEVGCENEERYV
jgi:hypothetical protein